MLISCKKSESGTIINDKKSTKDVIFYGNNEAIKNDFARENFEMGLSKIAEKDYKNALPYFLKAQKLEKRNVLISNSIANTEYALGNYKEAIEMMNLIILMDPTYTNSYSNFGQILIKEKHFAEAKEILLVGLKKGISINLEHKAVLLLNLAISCNKLNECNDSIKFATEAFKITTNESLKKYANNCIKEANKIKLSGKCN